MRWIALAASRNTAAPSGRSAARSLRRIDSARAEPPASIVFAIRSRESYDRGAVIEASLINETYESGSLIARKQELL